MNPSLGKNPHISDDSLKGRTADKSTRNCSVCAEDNLDVPAVIWCHDCQKSLCESCIKCHTKYKPDDNITNLRQPDTASSKCIFCSENGKDVAAINCCSACYDKLCITCTVYHKKYRPGHTVTALTEQDQSALKRTGNSQSNLKLDNELSVNIKGRVLSLCVSDDDQVFLACFESGEKEYASIEQYTESGKFVCRCELVENGKYLCPCGICAVPSDTIAAVCGFEQRICFLKRKKNSMKIKKIIRTEDGYFSVCSLKDLVYACDGDFGVDIITKKGEMLRSFKARDKYLMWNTDNLIWAEPETENIWLYNDFTEHVYCFDPKGNLVTPIVKTGNDFESFCVDKDGVIYTCNSSGIFTIFLQEQVWKKEKKAVMRGQKTVPHMFLFKNRIFLSIQIEDQYYIKIFNMG